MTSDGRANEIVVIRDHSRGSETRQTFRVNSFNGHEVGDGERVRRHACQLGFEGIVSKTADAPYASGNRGLWRALSHLASKGPLTVLDRFANALTLLKPTRAKG